jgi:hypothetical protein
VPASREVAATITIARRQACKHEFLKLFRRAPREPTHVGKRRAGVEDVGLALAVEHHERQRERYRGRLGLGDKLEAQASARLRDFAAACIVWQGDEAVPAGASQCHEQDPLLLSLLRFRVGAGDGGLPEIELGGGVAAVVAECRQGPHRLTG